MHSNPAYVAINGQQFEVIAFTMTEQLNALTALEVQISHDQHQQFVDVLHSKVQFHLTTDLGTKRCIKLIVTKFQQDKTQSTLLLKSPAHQLTLIKGRKQFYQENPLSLLIGLLNKAQVDAKLIDIQQADYPVVPSLNKQPQQCDWTFCLSLIKHCQLNYSVNDDGAILLYARQTSLSDHAYPQLRHYPTGLPAKHDTAAYFDRYHQRGDYIDITSSLSAIHASAYIKVQPHGPIVAPHYLITQVSHFYHRDNSAKPYHNKITLLAKGSHSATHKEATTAFAAVKKIDYSKVVSANNKAGLSVQGHYHYQFIDVPLSQQALAKQPPMARALFSCGNQRAGIHYPLSDRSEVLLGYMAGDGHQGVVLGSFFNADASGNKNGKYNQSLTRNQLSVRLSDDIDQRAITLKSAANYLAMHHQAGKHQIAINSLGSFHINGHQQVLWQAKSIAREVAGDCLLSAQQQIINQVQGDQTQLTEQNLMADSSQYQQQANQRLQLKGQRARLTPQKQLANYGKNKQQLTSKKITIRSQNQLLASNRQILLVCGDNMLRIGQSNSAIKSKQLAVNNQQQGLFKGQVNHQSSSANLTSPQTPKLPKLVQHQASTRARKANIDGLIWSGHQPNLGETVKALFAINNQDVGSQGEVVIYRCKIKERTQLQRGSLKSDSDNETLSEVCRLPFTVGDEAHYSNHYAMRNHPGDAILHINWQGDEIEPPQDPGLYGYRFAVELNQRRYSMLSNIMQWFACVPINHTGDNQIKSIVLTRNLISTLADVPTQQTYHLEDNCCLLSHVPLDSCNDLQLIDTHGDVAEVLSEDYKKVLASYPLQVAKKNHQQPLSLTSLMPPVILNFRDVDFEPAPAKRKLPHLDKIFYSIEKYPPHPEVYDLYFSPAEEQRPKLTKKQDKHSRLLLTEHELAYFKNNGNNATLFIHGFNVHYGELPRYLYKKVGRNSSLLDDWLLYIDTYYSEQPASFDDEIFNERLKTDDMLLYIKDRQYYGIGQTNVVRSVKQKKAKLKTFLELNDEHHQSLITLQKKRDKNSGRHLAPIIDDEFNGSQMKSWLIHMEDNLNRAAGFKDDYRDFGRAIFFAWPGDPENPADYMTANQRSKLYGRAVADVIKQLRKYSPDMEINIIGHSQGNGVVLSALNYLRENHFTVKVDHAFLWQAALPNNALEGIDIVDKTPWMVRGLPRREIQYIHSKRSWCLPYAHDAAYKITVLHSQNDNIVGPITEQDQQPEKVHEEIVFQRKPDAEFYASIFASYLGFGSLYEAANVLGIPASNLLNEETIDAAYQDWYKTCSAEQKQTLKPNLQHQYHKIKAQQPFHLFCRKLMEQIRKNHYFIHEKLNFQLDIIKSYRYEISVEFLLKFLAKHGNHHDIFQSFYDHYKSVHISKKNSPFIKQDVIDAHTLIINKVELLEKLTTFIYYAELTTFIYYAELAPNHKKVERGMGWSGVDVKNNDFYRELAKKGKLNVVDTTRWLYHHSDMFDPSEDIMEHIYKEQIIDYIHYAQYENTGRKKQ